MASMGGNGNVDGRVDACAATLGSGIRISKDVLRDTPALRTQSTSAMNRAMPSSPAFARRLAAVFLLLFSFTAGASDEIYLKIRAEAPVIISSGGEITVETGDCYPLVGYDSGQTLVELKFGPFTFWARKESTEMVPVALTGQAAREYRAALARFNGALATPEPPLSGTAAVRPAAAQPILPPAMNRMQQGWPATEASIADGAVYPVDASSPEWQNSGIAVKAGQQIEVEANPADRWSTGLGPVSAAGYDNPPASLTAVETPIFHEGTINQDWHWGALLCAVAESRNTVKDPQRQMEIGLKRTFTAANDGYLFFLCNDNPYSQINYTDNSGFVHVKVSIPGGDGAVAESPGLPLSAGVWDDLATSGVSPTALRQMLRIIIHEELRSALAAGAPRSADAFPVDAANDAWQNSGVRVKAGQHVEVQADEGEKWDIGWGLTDAKGYAYPRDPQAGVPVYHTGQANDDWHWGALICAVGDGRSEIDDSRHEVEVGTKRGFTVDSDGFVYFIVNDTRQLPDGRNGFDDNSGIIHVNVTVTDAKPAPQVRPANAPSPAPAGSASPTAAPSPAGTRGVAPPKPTPPPAPANPRAGQAA